MATTEAKEDRGPFWVDPRQHPDPPLRVPARAPAPDLAEVLDLIRLCREGRVYAVEQWIRDGKPLQARDYRTSRSHRVESPLRIAIDRRQHDLAHLLLSNGYAPDVEEESPLDRALGARAWDFVELLLVWGADPRRVDPGTVLDTYDSDLMERFWDYGVDFTYRHCLASYLSYSTRNRPAYGWARRHQNEPRVARDLAMALGEAIVEDREKAVHLLLWAGADPHQRVPDLKWYREADENDEEAHTSAVEWAVTFGKGRVLPLMKPDPQIDDFDRLWSTVSDPDSADLLSGIRVPTDWSPVIVRNIHRMTWEFGDRWMARRLIERASETRHAQIAVLDEQGCSRLRRDLLKAEDSSDLRWLLQWLGKPDNCEPSVYLELTRTDSMQKRLAALGLLKKTRQRRQAKRLEKPGPA